MHILISNLNRLTTASQLSALFFQFGIVSSVRIMRNAITGRSTGVGYIDMEKSAGQQAIRMLNDILFMNSFIFVEETLSKTT